MKKLILASIIILSILHLNAQITRINHLVAGTQISYYPNECGNDIPEAEGKLTFCDVVNNLGVVDASLGLNTRHVHKMIPNHFNNYSAFVTSDGISIEKEDGTWENIPNRAIPSQDGGPSINNVTLRDAVVLPNGTIPLLGSNLGPQLDIYNLETKEISYLLMEGGIHYPSAVAYDPDRNVAWIIARQSNNNYLYKLENEILTLETEIADGSNTNIYESDLWQYSSDKLFKATNNGLTVIEIGDLGSYSESFYDNTDTGILPFDNCYDMEIDNEGNAWIIQAGVGAAGAGVVKFDSDSETFDLYTQPHPSNPDFDLSFNTIGLDRNTGVIWLVSNNYSGFYTLEFDEETPVWNQVPNEDFVGFGVPYIYNVNFIHTQGSKTYFCTSSNSTSSNENYEVLILEDNQWTGLSDDDPGNISSRMVRRFQGSYSDNSGGVWWLNRDDEDLVYWEDDENFMHYQEYDPISEHTACINQNQNLVLRSEEGFGEFLPPSVVPFEETTFSSQPQYVAAWANEIWAASSQSFTPQHLVRYIDGEIIQEYEFDEVLNYFHFTMTTDKKAVFAKVVSGAEINVKIFDPVSEEFSEINYPGPIGLIVEMVPAENGNFWIIGRNGMLFYNGSELNFYGSDNLDISDPVGNYYINSAVLDQEQNLHFLLAGGDLYSIAQPYDNFEIATEIRLAGNDGIMPYYDGGAQGFQALALDSDGDFWVSRFGGLLEIQGATTSEEFDITDIVDIEELSNNQIDFKMFPNPNSGGELRVILPEEIGQFTLSIFDLQGKLIDQHYLHRSIEEIDLKNIISGMYTVNISNEDYSVTKKLVVE